MAISLPDLAIEIRSPSTWRYDIGAKKSVYEREGLPELWLVDGDANVVLVFRRSAPGASEAGPRCSHRRADLRESTSVVETLNATDHAARSRFSSGCRRHVVASRCASAATLERNGSKFPNGAMGCTPNHMDCPRHGFAMYERIRTQGYAEVEPDAVQDAVLSWHREDDVSYTDWEDAVWLLRARDLVCEGLSVVM